MKRETCDDDRKFLKHQNFHYCIVDEGHMLKNAYSSRYRNISELRVRRRLLLTGTPVQNHTKVILTQTAG